MLPVHGTNTIGQYKDQRYEIMNGSIHIRRGSKVELEPVLSLCTEGSVQSSLRDLGGVEKGLVLNHH